ncbi:MAG: molybdopterin molybdotransferase MoeA, partial [Planctomycetaceae bacterium]|nr:molybdopterin molybdotransferase MoeA [Planctomycetaceae bacterium]
PLPGEFIPLENAAGRILAEAVLAPIDVPAFDRSAMDGYAVHAEETVGAGEYSPVVFNVIGESLPGTAWQGTLSRGDAVRIMTGAPLPVGADAVVPAELTRAVGDSVEVRSAVPVQKNVGRSGEDIRVGVEVLTVGRQLRPQDVAVLASLGFAEAPVIRAPRVRLLITGNELVPPGELRQEHQIYEANSYLLRGLVTRDQGELESVQRLRDDPGVLRSALNAGGADVILISGGSSVGREDHAPRLLAELGTLAIHGIAMRPSSPAGMGQIGDSLVFLLPGNPVSCLCAYDFFAGRAIRQCGGRDPAWPYRQLRATLARKLVSEVGRTDYCRVRVTEIGVEPLSLSGASILSSTTRADGFVVVPEASEGYAPGDTVDVWLYDR